MNRIVKKMVLIFMALAWISGCSQGKADNSDNIDALKAHMIKHDASIRITPIMEAFAALVADEAKKQELLTKANESYAQVGIHNIYLVTGATAETNETVLGSLVHFINAKSLSEAKALLEQDDKYKGQTEGMVVNGHFALAPATIGGKMITPKALIEAFKDFN